MTHRSYRDVFMSILAASALALAACGGGGSVYDDPIAGNDQFVEDQCSKVHECRDTYPFSPEMFAFLYGDYPTQCINLLDMTPEIEQAVPAIEEGRIIYSPSSAKECNEGRLALDCNQYWSAAVQPVACDTIFTGTVANGGACTFDLECISEFCNFDSGQCQGVYDDPITANDRFVEDQCFKSHECRSIYPFPQMFASFYGDNPTQCIDLVDAPPELEQAVVAAIDEGRVIYSPSSAKECNEGRLALDCDPYWSAAVQPVACDTIFTGTVANGGQCTFDLECISEFCDIDQCQVL